MKHYKQSEVYRRRWWTLAVLSLSLMIASNLLSPIWETLAAASKESFMDGWEVMVLIMAGVMVFAAGFALKFMPPQHLPREEMDRLAAQYS
ncbi:MAG: hypothetical protein R6U37_05380 [Dehalococcoidia bacterium]